MDKVIVVGCNVPGIAVIRALANKNLHIIALRYSEDPIAHVSKYVSESVRVPHPEAACVQFVDFLINNAVKWGGALILETADHTAVCISKHKEILAQYYRIITPDWEILSQFIEKEKTYALAQECDVPYPKYVEAHSLAELESMDGEINYPCILKPVRSHEFIHIFRTKNFEVSSVAELMKKFQLCLDAEQPVIIQEIIPGPDTNIYKLHGYINSRGVMDGKFFYRKLRQNPPRFGVMRVGISMERNRTVEKLSKMLLEYVNYRGYFNTEFKRDPRDDQLKLIEVNVRMPRGLVLPTASGVNYPWLIYLDLVRNQQVDVSDYKVGFYWIELYADVKHSLLHYDQEDISLRDYFRPYLSRDKAFAVMDSRDMKPFLKLSAYKIRRGIGKALNRFGNKS